MMMTIRTIVEYSNISVSDQRDKPATCRAARVRNSSSLRQARITFLFCRETHFKSFATFPEGATIDAAIMMIN